RPTRYGEKIRFQRIGSKVETSKHNRRDRVCPQNLWFLSRCMKECDSSGKDTCVRLL
ncbi:hypothetical protein BHE74_00051902, partial [Ensete ventricosum]